MVGVVAVSVTALGLTARRISILADGAAHDLDLRGIGRLLAFTSNDEVNALATSRFARVFGRREVFQLTPSKHRSQSLSVPEEFLGRLVGIGGLSYATIDDRSRQGWRGRGTPSGPAIETAVADELYIPMVRVAGAGWLSCAGTTRYRPKETSSVWPHRRFCINLVQHRTSEFSCV